MRVNIYAEEMTDRVELVKKGEFVGVRFYLYLPVTCHSDSLSGSISVGSGDSQIQGPFIHRADDDDSAAVTFWGKRDLKVALIKALALLDAAPEAT